MNEYDLVLHFNQVWVQLRWLPWAAGGVVAVMLCVLHHRAATERTEIGQRVDANDDSVAHQHEWSRPTTVLAERQASETKVRLQEVFRLLYR